MYHYFIRNDSKFYCSKAHGAESKEQNALRKIIRDAIPCRAGIPFATGCGLPAVG
jgi:hypothetical protein